MVTTHTVTMKLLSPLGGASRGGFKSYVGEYSTEALHAHSKIQLSPTLNVKWIDVKEYTTRVAIPLNHGTASTGLFNVGGTTASTGVLVYAVGK